MSKFMKSAMMFLLAAVMMFAVTVTAYADYNGYNGADYPYETETPDYELTNGYPDYDYEMPYEPPTQDPPIEEPPIQEPPLGSLVIINSNHDGHLLQGATFAVYRAGENVRLAELTTDITGRTYEIPLPQGNYHIVIVTPAPNHAAITDRIHVTVTAGERQEITVFSLAILPPIPTPTPQPPTDYGRLLITNRAHGTGHLLGGAIFEVRRAMDNEVVATLMTDFFGEAATDLPIGDYFVRKLEPASDFLPNTDRINARIAVNRITEVNVISRPIPEPTPPPTPPPVEYGRLLVTLRAHGTNNLLSGAVFELRRAIDNEVIATLITDGFGEASINLPTGDYFLRELQAPRGFTPNPDRINVRIAANRLNEVNLTSRPIAEPTPTPPQEAPPEPGRLIITARAEGTNELLAGIRFEVRRTMDNRLMAELVTDRFGEAAVTLMPGDYHLRQTAGIVGFDFNPDRVNVRIAAGAINEITVTNRTHVEAIPEPTPSPAEPQRGRLLITVISEETGERLEGAVITVHHRMTDDTAATLVTNRFGEASVFLPQGDFFMRQIAMPEGYRAIADRINFTIRGYEITDMTIEATAVTPPPPEPTPTPPPTPQAPRPPAAPSTPAPPRQGQVTITARAEQSGNPIVGVTFGVYRQSDNMRVTEITTDYRGLASLSLAPGDYFLRNYSVPFGFLHERARIFFTVGSAGAVAVDITMQRDWNIPYAEYGFITLPQTGELPPVMNFVLGTLFLAVSLTTAATLICGNRKQKLA